MSIITIGQARRLSAQYAKCGKGGLSYLASTGIVMREALVDANWIAEGAVRPPEQKDPQGAMADGRALRDFIEVYMDTEILTWATTLPDPEVVPWGYGY